MKKTTKSKKSTTPQKKVTKSKKSTVKKEKVKPVPVTVVPSPEIMAPKIPDEWQVREAANTLRRAKEIEGDSKMMKLVNNHISKEIANLQKIKQSTSKRR